MLILKYGSVKITLAIGENLWLFLDSECILLLRLLSAISNNEYFFLSLFLSLSLQ